MERFIKRFVGFLKAIGIFIGRYILVPTARYIRRTSINFYQKHQNKLTTNYWQQKKQQLQNYNWRKAKLSDFTFIFKGALRAVLFFLLITFIFYLVVYANLLGSIPSRTALKAKQNNTASEVYSADGVLLGRYYIQDRTNVKYDNIAPKAIEALIATEDVRFYKHFGIDPRSLTRVFFKTLLMQDEGSGGGSTISQQLAKNLYPRRNYWLFSTPINKLREFIIARRLEKVYSKQEILELYLNTVPMGGDLFGIERAAQRFFNTAADSLETEEAAVLIGMLKATTTYNPRLDPEKSRQRRNVVLNQMVKANYLSEAKAAELKEKPLKLNYHYETHNDGLAPYFREQLRLELVKWCATQQKADGKPYNLYTDGLKIYTTLDATMQKAAENAVRLRMKRLQGLFDDHWKGRSPWGSNPEILKTAMLRSDRYRKLKAAGLSDNAIADRFEEPVAMEIFSWKGNSKVSMSPMDSLKHYQKFLNAGLIAVEPQTGFVRAWVGGIDHKGFKYDHVRSKRQVGSTFKPILYAAALEQGMDPCTYFPNQRVTYAAYNNWSPRNADGEYGGEYSMRGALAHSVNTISAQVMMRTGVEPTVSLAHRLGIQTTLPRVPALALGTADLSLFEMVQAYATLANDGFRVTPVYITHINNRQGETIKKNGPDYRPRKAIASEYAAAMVHLLQGVIEEGSAGRVRSEFGLQMAIAGKTGTTQNHSDGWFIGMTPNLVTGVWVGAENPAVRFRTLALGQGSNTALPIWGEFMTRIVKTQKYAGYRYSQFRPLTPEWQARLACSSMLENMPAPVITQTSFIDRFFNKVRGKGKEKKGKGWFRKRGKRGRDD